MSTNFNELFRVFVCERLGEKSEVKDQSPLYMERYREVMAANNQLMNVLTGEQKKLFIEFSNADVALSNMEEENAYFMGLRDGLELAKMLENI